MMRKVSLEKASGLRLGHDITEVNPEKKFKGRAFKRGHLLTEDDLLKESVFCFAVCFEKK